MQYPNRNGSKRQNRTQLGSPSNVRKGSYARFHIDGVHIVCKKVSDNVGFICVDDDVDYRLTFNWADSF